MHLADDWVAPEVAFPQAKAAATLALKLDPTLPEAPTSLGKVLGWHEWRFAEAADALRRAVASSPSYAEAHWTLGSILPTVGLLTEAIAEMRTSASLDPMVHRSSRWVPAFCSMPAITRGIEQSRKTIELVESNFLSYLDMDRHTGERGRGAALSGTTERGRRYRPACGPTTPMWCRRWRHSGTARRATIMTRLEEERGSTRARRDRGDGLRRAGGLRSRVRAPRAGFSRSVPAA